MVAGVISPEEAATARFMPGLGIQFTDIESDEADRLEELLTSLGIERSQAVVAPQLRRTHPGVASGATRASSDDVTASDEPTDPEAILREISDALEAEEAPLATSKPALPPQPSGPPPPAAQPQPSEAARLMTQIRGLLFQLADTQGRLRQREAEVEELRAQLEDAHRQIEQLQRGSEPRRMN
jgi:hypothetical protein